MQTQIIGHMKAVAWKQKAPVLCVLKFDSVRYFQLK